MADEPGLLPKLPSRAPRWAQWLHWGLTGALIVFAYVLKMDLDYANARQAAQEQEFDQRLKERAAQLEESRDRFARYQFVMNALADADPAKDRRKAILAVNVARLALTQDEQETLFASLELSPDTAGLGKTAVSVVESAVQDSIQLEQKGYQALAQGDVIGAQQAFRRAEMRAPGRNFNWELDRELRDARDPQALKRLVAKGYLRFAPPEVAGRVEQQAAATPP